MKYSMDTELVHLELTCGHVIWITKRFYDVRSADHKSFWCTCCGNGQCFKADEKEEKKPPPAPKTTAEKVRALFNALQEDDSKPAEKKQEGTQ